MRKRTWFGILPILLTVLFGGCQRGVRVSGELARLDSLVDDHYDSVLSVLVQLDTKGMRKGERMYAQLLTGKAMNKADSLFTTDSVMKEVCDYFDRHGNSNQRMLAHYVLGCAYRDMGDAPRALQCYQEAVSQADTTRSDCDLSTLMRAHSQMGLLFLKQGLLDEDLREERIAEHLAWKQGDTLSALSLKQCLCNALFAQKQYEACISEAEKLYEQYLQTGYRERAAFCLTFCIKSCLALEQYSRAKPYLDLYGEALFHTRDLRTINGGAGAYYNYLAKYYVGTNRLDSAEYFYRAALPFTHLNNTNALLTYKGLSNVYRLLHQSDSVLKYTALYSKAKEKKFNESKAEATLKVKKMYDYSVSERETKQNKGRAQKYSRLAILLLSLSAILAVVFLWKRNRYKKRISRLQSQTEELDMHRKQLAVLQSRYAALEKTTQEQKETLGREIEAKQQQISSLEHIVNASSKSHTALLDSPVVELFRQKRLQDADISDEEWEELSSTIERCFPLFHSTIENIRENKKQYRMCLLTKCEFTPKDIMVMLDVDSSYTAHTKERLLKKLFHTEGNSRNFDLIVLKMR